MAEQFKTDVPPRPWRLDMMGGTWTQHAKAILDLVSGHTISCQVRLMKYIYSAMFKSRTSFCHSLRLFLQILQLQP
jgi:hypothetical protein